MIFTALDSKLTSQTYALQDLETRKATYLKMLMVKLPTDINMVG